MTDHQQIEEQATIARKINKPAGWITVITKSKLSANAKKTWFGFRFEKIENANIGRVIRNNDGNFSTIVALA